MVLEVRNTSDQIAVQSIDKYEESVDFQNNCRSYYLDRVEASESFKRKLEQNREKPKQTSMSAAMDRLRQEMVSLQTTAFCSNMASYVYTTIYF